MSIESVIFQPSTIATFATGMMATVSAAAAAASMSPKLVEWLVPKLQNTRLSDVIPYEFVDDQGIVHGKDGLRFIILGFEGTNLRFNDPDRTRALVRTRQAWLKEMGRRNIRVRLSFVRDRLPLGVTDEHPIPVMREIARTWNASLPTALSTELFAILSIKNEKNGAAELLDAAAATFGVMKDYKPWRLGDRGRPSPTSYLARQLAPISRPNPAHQSPSTTLAERLCADALIFDKEKSHIVFRAGAMQKYAAVFVVEDWAGVARESTMLELLSLRHEMTLIHDFAPVPQNEAVGTIAYQAKFARTANPGSSMADQFDAVAALLEKNSEEEDMLVRGQTTLVVYADDPDELKKAYSRLLEFRGIGMNFVWTNWAGMAHWLAQFPGYDDQARGMRLMACEAAVLSTLQYTPTGRQDSDWGKGPIAVFETIDGSPYRLQFHTGEGKPPLGHFIMIAPSMSGKTTLATYLAASAMRHEELKVYLFDRLFGCEVVTRALGGKYLFFDGADGSKVGLNPFQLTDTPANRAFLKDWLGLIGKVKESEYALNDEIAEAVAIAFDKAISPEWRNLRFLRESAFSTNGELRKRLTQWTNPEGFGKTVCATEDTLDLSSRLVGFDFTRVLESEVLGPAVVSYMFHRIVGEANGQPRLLFIDETEQLVRNEDFRPRYQSLLQEGRKARIVVGSAFQRPNAPDELGIGTVVRGQAPTVFFFRNTQASAEDYVAWNLSPQEWAFVRGETYAEYPYAVLLKRYIEGAGESVILNVDLRRLGKYLSIFNSGRGAALLARQKQQQHGAEFLPHYLDQYLNAA